MKLKTCLASFLSFALILSGSAFAGASVQASAASSDLLCVSCKGSNIGTYSYTRWASVINSYLQPVSGGGWMRVQGGASNTDNATVVEYFDADFHITDRKYIPQTFPVFGGFYAASNGEYYLVTGQNNTGHDNAVPTFDIAAYDSSWQLLGHDQVSACDTAVPFDAGSLRIAEQSGSLIIHTAHEMYSGHQSNYSMIFNMTTHRVTFHGDPAYTSHSFNQFVMSDGSNVIMLDHGDAYPRSVKLTKFSTTGYNGELNLSYSDRMNVIEFPPAQDSSDMYEVNYTGTAIGGLAASSTHYLVAYNQIDMTKINEYWKNYSEQNTRNIFVAAVPKNELSSSSVEHYQITYYPDGEKRGECPYLIQTGTDSFLLLWQKENTVSCTKLNGYGHTVGDTVTFDGVLTDCVPVLRNGSVYWYSWVNETVQFYQIRVSDLSVSPVKTYTAGHDFVSEGPDSSGIVNRTCTRCGYTESITVPTRFSVYWHSSRSEDGYYYPGNPPTLDCGDELNVYAYTNEPESSDNRYTMEVISGSSILYSIDPAGTGSVRDFGVNEFDEPQTECTLRIYPTNNPAIYKDFTVHFAHDYEDSETVRPADGPAYIMHTCRTCGHVWKETLEKPAITEQPLSVTAAVGDAVQFRVAASGTGLIYQWQYNTGSGWKNAVTADARTPVMSLDATAARDGNRYRCIVKNISGLASISNAVTLKVKPTVTAQPKDVTAAAGATAKFTVSATGKGLIYQWQYNTGSGWKNADASDARTRSMSLNAAASLDGYRYRCIIKSSSGAATISGAVTLKVKPTITVQPADVTASSGQSVSFSVTATGKNLIYQWQYNSGSGWKNAATSDARTPAIGITASLSRDGYQYRCIIKSASGAATISNTVTLMVKPKITAQPSSVTVSSGKTAKFTVTAEGSGLIYQWQTKSGSTWKNVTGARSSTLSVTASASANNSEYRCIVKSASGASAVSKTVKLTVR